MKLGLPAVFLAGLATVAWAGPAVPGVTVERAWLVAVEDTGRLEMVPGPRPEGAAEALYTIRFRYDGETEADGLVIVHPLPAGGRYIAGSATGPGATVTFSVDGGETFGPAEDLSVADEAEEARAAIADDYTHVRWELPGRFPPGMGGIVSYRALFGGASGEPAVQAAGG